MPDYIGSKTINKVYLGSVQIAPHYLGEDNLFGAKSSYRAYSRMHCSFVFPEPIPRPYPLELIMEQVGKKMVEGLKKGREAMRMSLKISPKASSSEAILKFWATGKMLTKAHKQNKKNKKKKQNDALNPDIAERAAVLANLKKQIALAKVNAQRAATIKAQEKIKEVKE